MTEEEISKEHNQLMPEIGMRIYRLCVPALEIWQMMNRVLFLNYEMAKLKKKDEKPNIAPVEPK